MSTITKATPRAIIQGIDDRSRRAVPVEPEQIPQHLPHVYLFTERGKTLPQLVSGTSLVATYGARSFDYLGPFANHQTVLANTVNAASNSLLVQRLKPADAKTAMLRLSLEVIKATIPLYQRNADGSFLTDVDGDPVPQDDDPETIGYVTRWVLNYANNTVDFGEAVPGAPGVPLTALTGNEGGATAIVGVTSTLYPIIDLSVSDHGSYGDRLGLRLSAPTSVSSSPLDAVTAKSLGAYMYRWQFVERPLTSATPNIVRSILGETSVDLALKPDQIHPRLSTEVSVNNQLIDRYEDTSTPGTTPSYGPFGDVHVYDTNIDTLLDLFTLGDDAANNASVGEGSFDTSALLAGYRSVEYSVAANKHLFNIVSGVDIDGAPYDSFIVLGAADGGVLLSSTSTQYATGGDDGDMSIGNFDKLVRNELLNYGQLEAPLLDRAKYPQSILYDSGFSMDTKKAMLFPIGLRKDMACILSTQELGYWVDEGEPGEEWTVVTQNDVATESANASLLKTTAELYPESEIFGTSVCRAAVVGHSGYLINSPYKGLLPLTIDIAAKLSRYMGAGIGRWTNGQAFDVAPSNQVSIFKDVNITYKVDSVYNKDWDAGLIWVQNFDRQNLFYPAFQTVYSDDTSVLNSMVTMLACVELEKVADRVWRLLVGNTTLTPDQFIERSDELIVGYTEGRFDGRFIIVPETFFTEADDARGYSWSAKIKIYANNMKTVGAFTIEAYRTEDFEQ